MQKRVALLALSLFFLPISHATASIVISEVMWSGTDLSTADEWIEIANTGTGAIDLSHWILTKNSSGEEADMLTIPEGTSIASGSTLLISNFAEAKSRLGIDPDVVTTSVSLANTQLLLKLYKPDNGTGRILIDAVDDGVGAPFAGSNDTPKASMERIDLSGSGQLKDNWQTATTFLNFDDGATLFGTPSAANGGGPSVDTFSPHEAKNFSAEVMENSGSTVLTVSWVPSTSLDLSRQILSYDQSINGSSAQEFSATATGTTFTSGFGSGTGIRFTLQSEDDKGNISSGVSTTSTFFPTVKITEVLANPKGADDEEWIEIGNFGNNEVNIAGWILDEGNSPDDYVIEPRTGSVFLLQPREHVSFPKSKTGLPLGNSGEELSLTRGFTLMDSWTYEETAEEVSFGRDPENPEEFRAFCVPTRNNPNTVTASNPRITIQSGETLGEGTVSINLIAEVQTGSTVHSTCEWNFGDDTTSGSCNPPSHSFREVGDYPIRLTYTNFCHEKLERILNVRVLGDASTEAIGLLPESSDGGSGSRGRGGSGSSGGRSTCNKTHYDGVRISEFVPNPAGSDEEGEWIELENISDEEVSLCGWELDDGAEGSRPYPLDSYRIPSKNFLVLEREQTKIAINNSDEEIRLMNPEGRQVDRVAFASSREGESYALRSDDLFVWTPYLTPNLSNRFRTARRSSEADTVIISAALPNPEGEDAGNEWIEVTNVGEKVVNLRGWMIDNREDSRRPFEIEDVQLEPNEVHRFTATDTNITLTNTEDQARLLDPAANLISLISWTNAASGRIYLPWKAGEEIEALVIKVIDGDTITVHLDGKEEDVRLIGVDTPETVHPSKPVEKFGKEASDFTRKNLEGKTVTLQFDEERIDRYNRLLAYVILNGTNFNGELIRRGFAYAYLRFPFSLSDLFSAFEEEARVAKIGLWAEEEVVAVVEEEIKSFSAGGPSVTNSEEEPEEGEEEGKVEMISTEEELPSSESSASSASSDSSILITEILSNPPRNGPLATLGEYLELYNSSSATGSLAGWILDDAPNESSKPYTFTEEAIIAPHSFVLLCNGTGCDLPLRISLNNEGEDLSIRNASGALIASLTFPKLKQGSVYTLHGNEWHSSLIATPSDFSILRTAKLSPKKIHKKASLTRQKKATPKFVTEPKDSLAFLKKKYRPLFHPDDLIEEPTEIPQLLAALLPQVRDPSLPTTLASTGSVGAQRAAPLQEIALFLLAFIAITVAAFSYMKMQVQE